jgi:hypothetical protein
MKRRSHRDNLSGTWDGTYVRKHKAQERISPGRKIAENVKSILQGKSGRPKNRNW